MSGESGLVTFQVDQIQQALGDKARFDLLDGVFGIDIRSATHFIAELGPPQLSTGRWQRVVGQLSALNGYAGDAARRWSRSCRRHDHGPVRAARRSILVYVVLVDELLILLDLAEEALRKVDPCRRGHVAVIGGCIHAF